MNTLANIFKLFYEKCFFVLFQAVLDPQLAAMKKIRKMQRKKEAKKRKVDSKNPNKMFKAKKAKLISNEDNDY